MPTAANAIDIDHLRTWIGRRATETDIVTAVAVRGLSNTLDRNDPPQPGEPLPPCWHWLNFSPSARQSELGLDGHPARGGFLPPVPLPRRMWAAGRLAYHQPIRVGETITRVSEVSDVTYKEGKTGRLVFVLVKHEISCGGGLAVSEEQDLVYRDPPNPGATPPSQPAPSDHDWSRTIRPDPVMLFRYSALTFNGHRIHYDRPYATEEEGYPGLVVQGPLTATLLLELVRRERPESPVARCTFRGVRPLFDTAPFTTVGALSPDGLGAKLWAADGDGALAMSASVEFAS